MFWLTIPNQDSGNVAGFEKILQGGNQGQAQKWHTKKAFQVSLHSTQRNWAVLLLKQRSASIWFWLWWKLSCQLNYTLIFFRAAFSASCAQFTPDHKLDWRRQCDCFPKTKRRTVFTIASNNFTDWRIARWSSNKPKSIVYFVNMMEECQKRVE